ncbi:PTS lactose/cellobiose transporter subunit IIA [Alteribacter populi]|uniref:PTS lactose/cellobiose transporter subunit IIA n=1 Tax=Alteribacter populi TaxID=2011011 RepID=UPI000BBAB1E6|nr:PTS lactose/cellobiose transporter subunit IIA [Alteribacter populi]
MTDTKEKSLEEISFQIILHSGNARSFAMEAMQLGKKGRFSEADEKLKLANDEFHEAHHVQTSLLTKESTGEGVSPNVLLIHAQDHLMNAMTVKDLALEIIELHQKFDQGGH